jgi:hypothetical protein
VQDSQIYYCGFGRVVQVKGEARDATEADRQQSRILFQAIDVSFLYYFVSCGFSCKVKSNIFRYSTKLVKHLTIVLVSEIPCELSK